MGSTKACGKVVVCGAVKRTLMRPPLCACLKPLTQIGARLTKNKIIMKQRFLEWWNDNNMTFSAIAGETFTNGQVVLTHIGLVVFLIVAIIAGK